MRNNNSSNNSATRILRRAAAYAALAVAAACAGAQTYTLNVLAQFPSPVEPVGASPLLRDAAGNLYGMTSNGSGAYGYGSVYELVNNNGSYSLTTLYSFTGGSDGANPQAGLAMDSAGNLYGTANQGGNTSLNKGNGGGTVFELQNDDGAFNFVVLHTFAGPPYDGNNPSGTLAIDSAGNLYGTTGGGGNGNGSGTVFELANNGAGGFTFSLLHSFVGTDGAGPAMVVIGPGNVLYGICKSGGPGFVQGVGGSGFGTVYMLPIAANAPAIDIYQFTGDSNSGTPIGPPTVDAQGDVFVATSGTTSSGVIVSGGSVIELVNSSGGYAERTLYTFPAQSNNPGGDASSPSSPLILDAYGNLFGSTGGGGAYGEASDPPGGYGTVYELVNNAGSYQESVLFSAAGNGNGIRPTDLLMDQNGNFYGTFGHTSFTVGVGGQGDAEVWELAVQPATTSLALSASPNPAFYGDDVTLTAVVTANPAGALLPGTVSFSAGSTPLGSGFSTNGTVSITIPSNQLGAGADTITAQFTPSILGVLGTSASIMEIVNGDSDIAVLSGSNTFNGNQTVNGALAATSFSGNGADLTNVTATNFSGTILDSQVTGLTLDLASAEATAVAQAESNANGTFVPLAGGTMTGTLNLPSMNASGAVASGSLTIGGGTAITQYVSVTDTITLPAINSGQCTTFTTAALTNFTPGSSDTIALGIPSMLLSGLTNNPAPAPAPGPGPAPGSGPAPPPAPAPPAGPAVFLTYQAWETSTSPSTSITIEVCNPSAPYPGGGSGTIRVDIFKH